MFQGNLKLKEQIHINTIIETEYHRISCVDVPITEIYPGISFYKQIRKEFEQICLEYGISRHNAIAFWMDFFTRLPEMKEDIRSFLLLSVPCSYGDFFSYSFIRFLPSGFLLPECAESLSKKELRKQERIFRIYRHSNPEYKKSVDEAEYYMRELSAYFRDLEEFREWEISYHSLLERLHSTRTEISEYMEETAKELSHIFCGF